ncbi:putative ribonuclease H-like domain-containing protein, partial [Tanacetum coccineum]
GSSQDYILMPLWNDGSLFDSSSKNASNDEPQPSSDAGKKDDEGVSKESGIDDQERPENSSQDVNTTRPSINTASSNANTDHVPLEATHADFFGDETEVDMSNITTTYPVPSTLNTRIHKVHSLDHVISDEEPKKVIQALKDPSWIEAMQEELLQFKLQQMKEVDKTLFIKRVKSDILLVQVYVDDIIFGSTKKKLCIEFKKLIHKKFQMSSMGELTFFLELQVTQNDDAIYISQDKFMDEILKKFGFSTVKTASTPMETSKP